MGSDLADREHPGRVWEDSPLHWLVPVISTG